MIKILLVEDNPGDQKLFEDVLKEEQLDCDLIKASSANESVEMIFQQKPDLIVMDIKMSGLSGMDFVHLLQSNSATNYIPIIFLTGVKEMISSDPKGLSMDNKIYPILRKPVDAQELKKAMSLVLRKPY